MIGAPTLSTVATSGSYADLIGAPTLSTVATSGSYADLIGAPTLSTVAASGSYDDLLDKPAIPTASTDLSDTADLARLASPDFTGAPTSTTPVGGDDSTKIATTAFVQAEIVNLGGVNSLDDLSDLTLSGTESDGDVLRYNGAQWVDSSLASTDLSDTADLARLASPDLTGAPTSTTPALGDDTTKIATTAYVQAEITNLTLSDDLSDLTDVTLSGTLSDGDVLRYNGAQWVDTALSYADLTNQPTLPSSSDDLTSDHTGVAYTGANTDSVTVHLSGIDTELNNRADTVNSIAVVNGAVTIDSDDIIGDRTGINYAALDTDTLTAHLAGIDTALASAGGSVAPTLIDTTALTALTVNTEYVISPTITGAANIRVPAHGASAIVDGSTIIVTNLSDQSVNVSLRDTSGQGALYYADGTAAPTVAVYTRQLTVEAQGTIRLYQAGAGDPAKWYVYHSPAFEVETDNTTLATGDALNYDTGRKAFLNAGAVHGELVLTANISKTVYARHLYVTAYDETTARTISLPDMFSANSFVEGLDGNRFYVENRGSSTLTINLFDAYNFQNGITYTSDLLNLDSTAIAGNSYTLQSGERVVIETLIENANATSLRVNYRLGKLTPDSLTSIDTSGTASTITHGREDRLVYIVNTANDVTVTLPSASACKPSYEIVVKSIGTGTTTVNRAGSDTFDGLTSFALDQNELIALSRRSTSTWIITSTVAPESSDDLLSDHTGVNYTGANTDSITVHLSGIDTELNNRADTVNSQSVVNGAVTIASDDIVGEHTGVNYTAANTASITAHLSGIDTALAGAGGGSSLPSITTLSGNASETLGAASGGEEIYLLNQANVDVYMVAASSVDEGFKYHFKYMANGGYYSYPATINVNASSSDTIDDGTSTSIDVPHRYDSITLVSDGTSQWYVI